MGIQMDEDILYEIGKTYKVTVRKSDTIFSIYTITVSDESKHFVRAIDKKGLEIEINKEHVITKTPLD